MNPDPAPASEARAKDRSFLVSEDIRPGVRAGRPGYLIRVRLTSYRSLPLSCIENIELRVDGAPVEPERLTLILNGSGHKLPELGRLSHLWWWIVRGERGAAGAR